MPKYALLFAFLFSLVTPTHAQENMTLNQWAARFKMKIVSVLDVPNKPSVGPMTVKVDLKVYPNGRVRDIKVVTRPRSVTAETWIIERIARIRNVQPVRTDQPFNVSFDMVIHDLRGYGRR